MTYVELIAWGWGVGGGGGGGGGGQPCKTNLDRYLPAW